MTIVLYLYREAFINNYFGYGAAVGWGMFVLIALFSLVNWRLVKGSQLKRFEAKAGEECVRWRLANGKRRYCMRY